MRIYLDNSKTIDRLKKTIIVIVSIAIFIPTILTLIKFIFFSKKDFTIIYNILSYFGTMIGAVIGVLGAVLAVLISIDLQQKEEKKEVAVKKVHALNKALKLNRDFMLFSFNEALDFERESVDNSISIYLEKLLSFNESLSEIAIQVDLDYYNKCEKLFEEVVYLATLLLTGGDGESISKIQIGKAIVENLELFKGEVAKEVLAKSEKVSKENGDIPWNRRPTYNMYEVVFILRGETNRKLREHINLTKDFKKKYLALSL